MSRTHEMFHCPGATLARICPDPPPVSATCPMRSTVCAWSETADSTALASAGAGLVHACQAETSSERSLSGVRPATQVRTRSIAACPSASGASTVNQPAQVVAFVAGLPMLLWNPATASVVAPPVPVSSSRLEPASSKPKGLFGVHPWCVDGVTLP